MSAINKILSTFSRIGHEVIRRPNWLAMAAACALIVGQMPLSAQAMTASASFGVSVRVLPACEAGQGCGLAQIHRLTPASPTAPAGAAATAIVNAPAPHLTWLAPENGRAAGERVDTAGMAAGTPVEIAF